ncbi:MAG: nucleotidyltransferase domain-containing protein [Acidobacteria bacterium]|nr:nucleotidyltransferase domain-containing protein [Acidobacteriota bacterium]
MNESSDIDIVVELEKPKLFDLIGIKQDLEETLARTVDVIRIRKNMNKFLENRIEKEAIFV